MIKDLILDRGFLDGAAIARAKAQHAIDVTIGVKRNMEIFRDALGLARLPETQWQVHRRQPTEPPVPFKRHYTPGPPPPLIQRREAARQRTLATRRAERGEAAPERSPPRWIARLPRLNTWDTCTVPLDVVVCKNQPQDTLKECWAVLTTSTDEPVEAPVERYDLRVLIEERHRHLKCFWDLAQFTSPDSALVVNQIIFTALTYSLLQQQLLRQGRKALNKASKARLLEELVPVAEHVTVFTDQYYARFSTLEYTELALSVSEPARRKLLALVQKKKRQMRLRLLDYHPP